LTTLKITSFEVSDMLTHKGGYFLEHRNNVVLP